MNWASPPHGHHQHGGYGYGPPPPQPPQPPPAPIVHADPNPWGNALKPPRWALHPKGEYFAHAADFDAYLEKWKNENNVTNRTNNRTPPHKVHSVDSDVEEVDGPTTARKKKGDSPNGTSKFGDSQQKGGHKETFTPYCARCQRNYASMKPMCPENQEFVCPWCRLMHMDPWYPAVKILARPKKVFTMTSGIAEMKFELNQAELKSIQSEYQVMVRCVDLETVAFYPHYPDTTKIMVNGKAAVSLDPPKYLHTRREESKMITSFCKKGENKVIVNYQHPKQTAGWVFVVLQTRRVTMETIARSVSELPMDAGQARALGILRGHAKAEQDEELQVVIPKKEEISLRCPLTLTRIDIAAHGKSCRHLQAFDLQAFLVVNTQNKNLQTRWQCPVCQGACRPEDLHLDLFFQSILVADDTKNIVKIKVNEDGSYFPLAEEDSEPPESSDEEMPPAFRAKEPVVVSLDD